MSSKGTKDRRRRSITLPMHVLLVAEKKAFELHQKKLSSLINSLICKEYPQEIQESLDKMPQKLNNSRIAQYNTICKYCNKPIEKSEAIEYARFNNGSEDWVHDECCRE